MYLHITLNKFYFNKFYGHIIRKSVYAIKRSNFRRPNEIVQFYKTGIFFCKIHNKIIFILKTIIHITYAHKSKITKYYSTSTESYA